MPKFARTETNDHVLLEVVMFIAIGVNEYQDDIPPGFTDALRDAVKSTGAAIVTSSIIPKHRQMFKSTAREILAKFPDSKNKQDPT